MEIGRRNYKKQNQGRTINKNSTKIDLVFDLPALDLYTSFVFSENRYIRKSHYIQVRNLFELLNMELYMIDPEKLNRVKFIKKALDGKINHNIENAEALMYYVNGGIAATGDGCCSLSEISQLNMAELEWIMQTTTETLKCAFIYPHIDPLIDALTRFKNADFKDRYIIAKEIEEKCSLLRADCRKAEVESLTSMTFSLMPGKFEEAIADAYKQVTNPFRKLKTCMQGINELLNGGFEESRVYLLLGLTGVGKSLTMLNLIYQMKKANRGYKPKDPTKRPCIVLLTMENSVVETITRLFDIAVGRGEFSDYTIEELIHILRTEGELCITDDDPIDIIVKYAPDRSVDTGYMYTLVEDLEDEGYETIAFFMDHVKKIRSIYNIPDIRLELGSIINEMKVFAQLKMIPVITDSHLNRDAAKIIESAPKSKSDITRMLGKANIGESMLMLDNVDYSIILNKDWDIDGNMYMVFASTKVRDKQGRDYVCQPFKRGSGIALYEDINDIVPAFKDTLHDLSMLKPNTNIKASSYTTDMSNLETEDNIFSRITTYDSTNMNTVPLMRTPSTFAYMQGDQQIQNININIPKQLTCPIQIVPKLMSPITPLMIS